jgi:hypothetical protein
MELNSIRPEPHRLETIRLRLSDIAWWMRLLCQNIAIRANHNDREVGKFWQSRHRAVRRLDESTLLACAAYVDLNPIRAAMAETLEASDFTSVQRRIQSLPLHADTAQAALTRNPITNPPIIATSAQPTPIASNTQLAMAAANSPIPVADGFLSPLTIDERMDSLGPDASHCGSRCSDKGFLPISLTEYRELLDWTARQRAAGKSGSTPKDAPPILARLSLDSRAWCQLIDGFGRLFCHVAGRPQTIDATRSRFGQHRFHLPKRIRALLPVASPRHEPARPPRESLDRLHPLRKEAVEYDSLFSPRLDRPATADNAQFAASEPE